MFGRTPPIPLPPPVPCLDANFASPPGAPPFWSIGYRDGCATSTAPASSWPTAGEISGSSKQLSDESAAFTNSSLRGSSMPLSSAMVSSQSQPNFASLLPSGTSTSELELAGTSAHSALLKASLSSQAEHQRLRQIRDALHSENKQLQELVSRWQRAYDMLEKEHLDICAQAQEATDKKLEQLQAEKRFHLAELHKLQTENVALREENLALQSREKRLMEHSSVVYKHNERLRELLLHTRDMVSSQGTPASAYRGVMTPPSKSRVLAPDEHSVDFCAADTQINQSIATNHNGSQLPSVAVPRIEREPDPDLFKEAIESIPALARQKQLNDTASKVISETEKQLQGLSSQQPASPLSSFRALHSWDTNGGSKPARSNMDELLKDLESHEEALKLASSLCRKST